MQIYRRLSTYEALIEASFELLNANPKISLAKIAEKAGVGRATLHRHFSGRNDLILALAKRAFKETEKAAQNASKNSQSYEQALKDIFYAMIPLGNRHWFLSQELLHDNPTIACELERQKKSMIKLVNSAIKEGAFKANFPVEWIIQCYDHLIHAAWEMIRSDTATVKQAADLGWQTLINGLSQSH